jgi:hypothetical protein
MTTKSRGLLWFLAFATLSSASFAETPATTPAPVYTPAAGAVVSGLSGLVTGTDSSLHNYRSSNRIMDFRRELTKAILNADAAGAITVAPKNVEVLCATRGAYAALAARSAYINSITGTLDKFATPPKIATIGDALMSLFKNYSIDGSTGKLAPDTAANIQKKCRDDIDAATVAFYGVDVFKGPIPAEAAAAAFGLDPVSTALSTFSDLYQALITIITPLVTTPASVLDAKRRTDAIAAFLKKYRQDLLKAAADLADFGTKAATASRLQALGQFTEKMSAARLVSIDLAKIDGCKLAAKSLPASLSTEVRDAAGVVVYHLPTDAFAACYVQAWSQLSAGAQAAVTAAAEYDTLADTSSDQLKKAVKIIKDNIDKVDQPANVDINQLMSAATQLFTYGQAVSTALSSANIAKVKADVDALMKQFGNL